MRLMSSGVLFPFVCSILLCSPAFAQWGSLVKKATKKVGGDPNAKLREIDKVYMNGMKSVPARCGYNPAKEAELIKNAESLKKKGDGMMNATLKMSNNYKHVKARGETLGKLIKLVKLEHPCGVIWSQIQGYHKKRQPAPAAALDKLDAAVGNLAKNAPSGFKESDKRKAYWSREAPKLRQSNVGIAERAKKHAAREAARAAEQKKRAAEKAMKVAHGNITKVIGESSVAITPSQLSAFDSALQTVKELDPASVPYFQRLRSEYDLYNAIVAQDSAKIGQLLKGKVASTGETKGKTAKITVKVKPGHCSLVVAAWKSYAGSERWARAKYSGDLGKMQMFTTYMNGWKRAVQKFYGACSTKGGKFTMTSELDFAGTKNGLGYTIVEWPKSGFPVELAIHNQVRVLDHCDASVWESLWMDPIPGTLVWSDKEPYLLNDGWAYRRGSVTTRTLVNGHKTVDVKVLSAKAPGTRAISTKFNGSRCVTSDPTSAVTAKFNKCHRKVGQKYGDLRRKWSKKKKTAKRGRAWLHANSELNKLSDRENKEYARSCGKMRTKIDSKLEKTINKLIDFFTDNGVTSKLDTPARMRLEVGL